MTAMKRARSPQPLRILITAGPTREYIDPVRYISNESSGRMGFALAIEAARRGHRVTLVHGPVEIPRPAGVRCVRVVSAAEMLDACRRLWPQQDVLIKAAAVADYRPARSAATKLKKSDRDLTLRLEPTTDILAVLARTKRPRQVVIGFALEDRAPRARAAGKLERKGLDAIVLNQPSALSAERSEVEVLVRGEGWRRIGRRSKLALAVPLVALAERLAAGVGAKGGKRVARMGEQ